MHMLNIHSFYDLGFCLVTLQNYKCSSNELILLKKAKSIKTKSKQNKTFVSISETNQYISNPLLICGTVEAL